MPLRHPNLRQAIKKSWTGVEFEQAVFGYSTEQLNEMEKTITDNPLTFKFGIPYPWDTAFKNLLDAKDPGALLIDDLASRLEGDEDVKP